MCFDKVLKFVFVVVFITAMLYGVFGPEADGVIPVESEYDCSYMGCEWN